MLPKGFQRPCVFWLSAQNKKKVQPGAQIYQLDETNLVVPTELLLNRHK